MTSVQRQGAEGRSSLLAVALGSFSVVIMIMIVIIVIIIVMMIIIIVIIIIITVIVTNAITRAGAAY